LGLRNLTIIDEIVRSIEDKSGKKIDMMKIPLNDERTFQLIRNVDTMGVFQLESEGMKSLIRRIQPRTFEDIAATIALFRPGPMENIPEYLRCREDPTLVHYPHPSLEPILKTHLWHHDLPGTGHAGLRRDGRLLSGTGRQHAQGDLQEKGRRACPL
ncbi:MAG: hypothetical protein ACLVJX_02625, partial [Merdibacter sp.]